MDVASVDVIWNGFAQSLKIAALAETHEVACAPHNYYSHLATFIAAQWCAAIPNVRLLEIDVDDVPWREDADDRRARDPRRRARRPGRPGVGLRRRRGRAARPSGRVTARAGHRHGGHRSHFELSPADYEARRQGHLHDRRIALVSGDVAARARPGDVVLELGCGPGDVLAAVAAACPEVRFLGLDVDARMVVHAQSRHAAPNVEFRLQDLAEEAADVRPRVVFAIDVLHHVHRLDALVAHVAEALLPDGTWTVDRAEQPQPVHLAAPGADAASRPRRGPLPLRGARTGGGAARAPGARANDRLPRPGLRAVRPRARGAGRAAPGARPEARRQRRLPARARVTLEDQLDRPLDAELVGVLDEPRAGRVAEGRPAAHGLHDRRAERRRGRLRGDDPVDAVGDELGRSVLRARRRRRSACRAPQPRRR